MINLRLRGLQHGFLNISEQALTRLGDALFSLGLVLTFSPEEFAKLALAQALVAPSLLLFISPDSIIYREFSEWKMRGAGFIGANLHAFRQLAWAKVALAILVSALFAFRGDNYMASFASMLWAFSLVLMPQVAGPDREFLRLSLKLKHLNILTIIQKCCMLAGLYVVITIFHHSIPALAGWAGLVLAMNFFLTRACVNKYLKEQGAQAYQLFGRDGPSIREVLVHSLKHYSFWNHLSGIVQLWVQTMDLFFLGLFHLPGGAVGLYAFVLKISNMALLMPTAIASNVLIWIGRRAHTPEGMEEEWAQQKKFSLILGSGVAVALALIARFAPDLLGALARGRWTASEQIEMVTWMHWILAGAFFYATALPIAMWLQVRVSSYELFKKVYAPWLAIAATAYTVGVSLDGLNGAAQMNIVVGLAYGVLLSVFLRKLRSRKSYKPLNDHRRV